VSTALEKLDVIYDDREVLARHLRLEPEQVRKAMESKYEGRVTQRAQRLWNVHGRQNSLGLDAVRFVLQLLSVLKERDDIPASARDYIERKADAARSGYLEKLETLDAFHSR